MNNNTNYENELNIIIYLKIAAAPNTPVSIFNLDTSIFIFLISLKKI